MLINILFLVTLGACSSSQISSSPKLDPENATLINVSLRDLLIKTIDEKEANLGQTFIIAPGKHTMTAQLHPSLYKSGTAKLSFTVEAGKKYYIAVNLHEFSVDPSVSKWSYSISDGSGKKVSFIKSISNFPMPRKDNQRGYKSPSLKDPALIKALERQKKRKENETQI